MHWLLEILIDLITWLIPSRNHENRSIVGESRFDRHARLLVWAVVVLIATGIVGYALLKNS